jgi:hypothetical protein
MTEKNHSTLTTAPVPRYTLIWVGVLLGVAFYFFDVVMDSMVLNKSAQRDQLLHPTLQ